MWLNFTRKVPVAAVVKITRLYFARRWRQRKTRLLQASLFPNNCLSTFT